MVPSEFILKKRVSVDRDSVPGRQFYFQCSQACFLPGGAGNLEPEAVAPGGRIGDGNAEEEVAVLFRLNGTDSDFGSRIAVISAAEKMNPQSQVPGGNAPHFQLAGRQGKVWRDNRTAG